MTVKHSQEIEAICVPDGIKVFKKILIAREEAPNFEMRCFVIQPGGKMPKHINRVEHEQYILKGQARVGIGDDLFEVQNGDVVLIPAGEPHWYLNVGDESFEFLCVVPNKPDKIIMIP